MKVKVYSTPSCPYCHMAKDYFREKGIEFDDINVAKDRAAAMEMVEKSGQMGVPVIEMDGEIIVGFDVPKIENALNKSDKVGKSDEIDKTGKVKEGDEAGVQEQMERMAEGRLYDVVIIGGSAAGLTAAIFATRREMKTLVVTKDIGGQISETALIENYPGYDKVDGPGLAKLFEAQAKKYGADILMEEVVKVEQREYATEGKIFAVYTKDGNEYAGRTLILAMGKTPRSLKASGEKEFLGKGVSYCANCDAPLFRDKVVAVVGGGNSAFDAALFLSKIAAKVYLIHRREGFRAFEAVVNQLKGDPNCEFILNAVIEEIKGGKFVEAIRVKDIVDSSVRDIAVDGVFVEIGSVVETGFVKHLVDLDETGHILIDEFGATSHPGVFAAGDVTDVPFKQIIVAAGDGCKAALAAYNYLHNIENKYVADWKSQKPK
jgi:alkyl hydroperoxide reductase subunit F